MLGEFKKKFICILLSLTMIIGLGVHSSFAASSTPEYCIVINTKTNKMGYYKKGKMVKQFSIATGKSSSPTPTGKTKIVNKIKNRPYYSGGIPGGSPRNPLGDRWLGLHLKGTYGTTYAIHGNNNSSSIGKNISGGCIRMHNKDVRWLYDQVPKGTTVIIAKSSKSFVEIAKSYNVKLQSSSQTSTSTSSGTKRSIHEMYKYDAGKGKYLTYINGKGYSRYSYISKKKDTGFIPTTWATKAGLTVSNPSSKNGYKAIITNSYIKKYNDANAILKKAKDGKLTSEQIKKELSKLSKVSYSDAKKNVPKVSSKKTLLKNIYINNAGKGKYLTYANGNKYSQYSYLSKDGKTAYITHKSMVKVGLEVTMPTASNKYTMQINNPYIKKYNNVIKELESYTAKAQ